MIGLRILHQSELPKIREIDRTETIRGGYRVEAGELVYEDVDWDTPNWSDEYPGHNHGLIIDGAARSLDQGGTAFGAFDGDRLVGLAVYRPRLTASMSQLAVLHVSHGYRRMGIASRLFAQVLERARVDGAEALYVSATPSGSAVGFYLRNGFSPTREPNPELLAEEPDDIHMVRPL